MYLGRKIATLPMLSARILYQPAVANSNCCLLHLMRVFTKHQSNAICGNPLVANRAPHSDETLSSDDPAGDYDSDEIRNIAVASGEGHVALKQVDLLTFSMMFTPR